MSQSEITYELGDDVLLKERFFDENSSGLYDPDTVTLRTKDPLGVVVTHTPLVHSSLGNYSFEVPALTSGEWTWEWKATSVDHGDGITSGRFHVEPSVIDSTATSIIARLVQSLIPATWEGLKKADYYGEDLLTQRIQIAKYTALSTALAEADESTYTPLMRDYIATLAAIEIIPAGIEYWMQQKITVTATGVNESVSYTDRQLAFLRGLVPNLVRKAAALSANPNLVVSIGTPGSAPLVSGNDTGLLTSDPYTFPEAFDIAGNAL